MNGCLIACDEGIENTDYTGLTVFGRKGYFRITAYFQHSYISEKLAYPGCHNIGAFDNEA